MKKSTVLDHDNSADSGSENQQTTNNQANLRAQRATRGYNPKYDSATYLVDGQAGQVPLKDLTNLANSCVPVGGSAPKTEMGHPFMRTRHYDQTNTTPEQVCNRNSPSDLNPKDFIVGKTCSTNIVSSARIVTPAAH